MRNSTLEAVLQSVKQVLKHRGLDAPWATILAESSIGEEMQVWSSDRYVDSQRRWNNVKLWSF
jgi:hypothetical protein